MPDFITWTALIVSAMALAVMVLGNVSTDMPYTLTGFVVVVVLVTLLEIAKRAAPNPFKQPLYRINFGAYEVWFMEHAEAAPSPFRSHDRVIVKPLAGCLVEPGGVLVTRDGAPGEVLATEPTEQRQGKIPARALSRVNNLEAWLYHQRRAQAVQEAS